MYVSDTPCEDEMTELVSYAGITSSDPSVTLTDLPIGSLPATFKGTDVTITFPVSNADIESGIFDKATIVDSGVPNIQSVTVSYTPKNDPTTTITVVTNSPAGSIEIPNNPDVIEVVITITAVDPTKDTSFEIGLLLCLHYRGELHLFLSKQLQCMLVCFTILVIP